MASGTSPTNKRNSLQRLSHIFQLAPSFARLSLDANAVAERKKITKPHGSPMSTKSFPASSQAREQHERECNSQTASVLSVAESTLSSPFSPLLPVATPRVSTNLEDSSLPPTSNDLAVPEKAMLMRKMRKLSRVLGEVPVPQVIDEEGSSLRNISERRLSDVAEEQRPSSTLQQRRPGTSDAAKKVFRRSFTVGYGAASSGKSAHHELQKVKSLSSLQPALTIPSRRSVDGRSYSPIAFGWPEGERPIDTPDRSLPYSLKPDALDGDSSSTIDKLLRRRDSTASSVLLADQNTEQVQRARVAKLSRYLGEVPPDVLRRAVSPPPHTSSPGPSSRLTADKASPSSSSLRGRTPSPLLHRRPMSLDVRWSKDPKRASPLPSPSAPSSPTRDVPEPQRSIRRTRSLWAQGAHGENGDEDTLSQSLHDVGTRLNNEKQRILNVKRAKKMAQLFGDNPPTALFQITNLGSSSASVDDASSNGHGLDDHPRQRDSLATIISISTTSLSPSLGSANRRVRDSYISIITTSSEVSALVIAPTEEAEEKPMVQMEECPASVSPPIRQELGPHSKEPSTREVFPSPLSEPNLKRKAARPSTSPASLNSPPTGMRLNFSRALSPPSNAVIHQPPRTPPTPPPFSDFTPVTAILPRPATAPPATSDSSPQFQTRRRRAAKLSKFFGVEVSELTEVLPSEIMGPAVPAKAVLAHEQGVMPADIVQYPRRRPSTTVAETRHRRRFLGLNEENDVQEVDMTKVIDQLRRMKGR